MSAEGKELMGRPDRPIIETAETVSYLGVRLDKATNRVTPFVPKREQYADYIDDEFSLELQKTAAVAFSQGQPLLVEGGTSIGKTTAMGKMAAELGWEFHYVNLKGSTDADELMGKYIPNAGKKGPDDPEYIFADGKVSTGLRQEEGKKKLIVLDEYSSAHPNVTIRLHEVLDALGRNGNVVLTEDASESIPVDKTKTMIVALVNPPGKGYFGREPLDPAQLRRWVYIKAASDLPEKTFSYATKSLFGLAPQVETVSEDKFLLSRDQALLPEQLQEVPGIAEIVARYEEFHRAAKQLVKERRIGADQPQLFSFDDRVEPKRVHDFVLSFFNGDITETFQKALRYYYANKVESAEDKAKLEELISHVAYQDVQAPSNRRHVDIPVPEATEPTSSTLDRSLPSRPEGSSITSSGEAEKILGINNVIKPDVLDPRYAVEGVWKPVPFSKEELLRAKELGQFLVYRTDKDPMGNPLTMQKLQHLLQPKFDGEGKGKVLYDPVWYKGEEFFTTETPKAGWALVSKEVIPNSASKNYLQQIDAIEDYVKNRVFAGGVVPVAYQHAFAEYGDKKARIAKLIKDEDWKSAAKELAGLQVNKIFRQSPVEAVYDLMSYFAKNGERPLGSMYTWTNKQSSYGYLVDVGAFDEGGARVYDGYPDYTDGDLGVVFSR